MKALLKIAFATVIGMFASIGSVQGAFITTYDFTGEPGNQLSTAATGVAANMSAGVLSRGSGLTASSGANSINSSAFSTGGIDLNDYYGFTLTANPGFVLTIDSIVFSERRSATGIRDIEVRSSLDGFTSAVATIINVPDDTLTRRQTVTLGSAFDNIAGSVEFRVYGYNAEGASGSWRLGINAGADNPGGFAANLQVDGNVTAVPAPSSLIMACSAIVMGLGIAARRRWRAAPTVV